MNLLFEGVDKNETIFFSFYNILNHIRLKIQ